MKGVHQITWHDPSTKLPATCYSIAMFGQTHMSPYEWLYPTISHINNIMFPLYHTSLLVISDYTYTICMYIHIYIYICVPIFLYIPLYPFIFLCIPLYSFISLCQILFMDKLHRLPQTAWLETSLSVQGMSVQW